MRAFLCLLTALGGLHRRVGRPGLVHVLQVKGPATYAAADTTAAYAAVQDFARHVGTPSLLYVSTTGGHPEQNRCLRLPAVGKGGQQHVCQPDAGQTAGRAGMHVTSCDVIAAWLLLNQQAPALAIRNVKDTYRGEEMFL